MERIVNINPNTGAAKTDFAAEGKPLPWPNKPGLWLHVQSGNQIEVTKADCLQNLPRRSFSDSPLVVYPAFATFVRLHRIIDVEVVSVKMVSLFLHGPVKEFTPTQLI